MKQLLTKILLTSTLVVAANAGSKFENITADYLLTNASLNVRMVIAQDPKTSPETLKILLQDSNKEVRTQAQKNLG